MKEFNEQLDKACADSKGLNLEDDETTARIELEKKAKGEECALSDTVLMQDFESAAKGVNTAIRYLDLYGKERGVALDAANEKIARLEGDVARYRRDAYMARLTAANTEEKVRKLERENKRLKRDSFLICFGVGILAGIICLFTTL